MDSPYVWNVYCISGVMFLCRWVILYWILLKCFPLRLQCYSAHMSFSSVILFHMTCFFPNSGTSLYLPHWPSVFFLTFRINWAFCSAAVSAKIEVPSMGFPLPQLLDSGRCKRWTFRHGHFVGLLPPDFKESKSPHRLWEQDTYNNHEPQK